MKSDELDVEDIRPRLRLAPPLISPAPAAPVVVVPEEEDKQVFLAFNSWISWRESSAPDPPVFVILAIEARFVATLVTRDFSEAVESFLDEVVLCKKKICTVVKMPRKCKDDE